jgi:hypothetical protein
MTLGELAKITSDLETTLIYSPTWAFFKVKNNQLVDLFKNQIMICIIYHNNTITLEYCPSTLNVGKVSLHTISLMA